MSHLDVFPPRRQQFYEKRRASHGGKVTVTAIVPHTGENTPDGLLPDAGAEGLGSFIVGRSDPGSYHEVVDSDSAVDLIRTECEAFGEGTGGNRWAVHISVASKADAWDRMPRAWVDGVVEQFAQAAARRNRDIRRLYGHDIPARRITKAEYKAGKLGWCPHGDIDDERRTDPGKGFPWARILRRYAALTGQPYNGELIGPVASPETAGFVERWQRAIIAHGSDLGRTGPAGDGVDGDFGRVTFDESIELLEVLVHDKRVAESTNRELAGSMAAARADADRLALELQRANADRSAAEVALADAEERYAPTISTELHRSVFPALPIEAAPRVVELILAALEADAADPGGMTAAHAQQLRRAAESIDAALIDRERS